MSFETSNGMLILYMRLLVSSRRDTCLSITNPEYVRKKSASGSNATAVVDDQYSTHVLMD